MAVKNHECRKPVDVRDIFMLFVYHKKCLKKRMPESTSEDQTVTFVSVQFSKLTNNEKILVLGGKSKSASESGLAPSVWHAYLICKNRHWCNFASQKAG